MAAWTRNVARFLRYIGTIVLHLGSMPKPQGTSRVFLALLCVLLVVTCGTIQAAHMHPAGDISHADCALCATAHLAVQVVLPAVAVFVAPVISAVETLAPAVRSTTIDTFALYTRPPPVDAFSAWHA